MNKALRLDMGEKPQSHPETAVKNAGTCGKTTPLNEGGSRIYRKNTAAIAADILADLPPPWL